MSDQPKPCHHDPATGQRMLLEHHRDCRARGCGGCIPCLEPHCGLCGRRHLDELHPLTCPKCVGSVREDLLVIEVLHGWLEDQAVNAGNDGRLVAAAPIPGGTATVMLANYATTGQVRTYRGFVDDQPASDPVPPLLGLAHWEDTWRAWLRQRPDLVKVYDPETAKPCIRSRTATVERARAYLAQHLTMMAQIARHAVTPDGRIAVPPDFVQFAADMADLRTRLDHTLHDERGPDHGIGCFECGARLVRRHRFPVPCQCPPRPAVHDVHGVCDCRTLAGASFEQRPKGSPTIVYQASYNPDPDHVHAAIGPGCRACDWEARHAEHGQGGIDDPRAGFGWECPRCRRRYTPSEYVYAVRRDLLDSGEANAWTDMATAAEAAGTMIGQHLAPQTVRNWVDRGFVGVGCSWKPGRLYGARVVAWLDVAEQAAERLMKTRGRSSRGVA